MFPWCDFTSRCNVKVNQLDDWRKFIRVEFALHLNWPNYKHFQNFNYLTLYNVNNVNNQLLTVNNDPESIRYFMLHLYLCVDTYALLIRSSPTHCALFTLWTHHLPNVNQHTSIRVSILNIRIGMCQSKKNKNTKPLTKMIHLGVTYKVEHNLRTHKKLPTDKLYTWWNLNRGIPIGTGIAVGRPQLNQHPVNRAQLLPWP